MNGGTEQAQRNLDYYGTLTEGRKDYWRLMPAPRHRVRTIISILDDESPDSVLDVGCGDASLLAAIESSIPEASLAGIDISSAQIEQNRKDYPEMEFYVADVDGNSLPVERKFDAIVVSELIEHLDDPGSFLTKLLALSTAETLLVITTQSGFVGETERRVGHHRHFTASELTELLSRSGWSPTRVWNTGFPFHNLSKWIANRFPDTSMTHFAERQYGFKERLAVAGLRFLFRFNSKSRGPQLFAIAQPVVGEDSQDR